MPKSETDILKPSFDQAYWRQLERVRYRDHAGFSKKKNHFEPEDHNSFANRWAAELTREESAAEIQQIYENAVTLLKNKRSQMERSETSLDCAQFRFQIEASQDKTDPTYFSVNRRLTLKIPLNKLPVHFDEIFPYKLNELVVPFAGQLSPRELLATLEEWEEKLGGKIEESLDQTVLKLHLKSGFTIVVDSSAHEAIFSKNGVEGVGQLASAVATDLKSMGILKKLGGLV